MIKVLLVEHLVQVVFRAAAGQDRRRQRPSSSMGIFMPEKPKHLRTASGLNPLCE
jgi:hypothetical protein